MNKQNIKQSRDRVFSVLAVVGALTVGGLFTLPKAQADRPYGAGALYQIEYVSGTNGSSSLPVGSRGGGPQGGGTWLWFALYPDGTADYAGSDCGAGVAALSDKGDATWAYSGGSIVISNVVLNGLKQISNELGCPDTCVPPAPGQPDQVYFCYTSTTITVPAAYGHYTGKVFTFEGPTSGTTYKILVNCVEVDPVDLNSGMSLVQVAGGQPGTTP
jgi:hypothetical protein